MKTFVFLILIFSGCAFGENPYHVQNHIKGNVNISEGNLFDGEPYLSINPNQSKHMVVAWMGYLPLTNVMIKTKVTFDGGSTWSAVNHIAHTNPEYGSADPSIEFDHFGNVFLCYVDYSKDKDSGSVCVRKSMDGGLLWGDPVAVINTTSDPGKYPIDRPWISIDRSGGTRNGNIYITTMPPKVFGPLSPPYHPYFMVSSDGGVSFSSWQYLDTTDWLAGNIIAQPMPTHAVSSSGVFHAIYPSYLLSQNENAQFIIASSDDAGTHFSYHSVFLTATSVKDPFAKKGYLLRTDPSDQNHLVFVFLDALYGDIDVFITDSFDAGSSWTPPERVNDDPIGNEAMQDLVWADFDGDGDLVVSWRDRRNGSDATYKTASEIWAAIRPKDAISFSTNFRISDKLVAYDPILAFSGNDFMCIKYAEDKISAVWGDTRDGKLNIWFQQLAFPEMVLSPK